MTFSDLLKAYLLKAMANTQNRTYTKPEPRTLKAKTDMVNNCRKWSEATSFVKSGRQYIFEIVRPWDERHKYYYDSPTHRTPEVLQPKGRQVSVQLPS